MLERRFADRFYFLDDVEAQPFREMWVLARCALMSDCPLVRLAPLDTPRPDGYSRRDGLEFGAEVTEAMEPGRKRRLENWKPGEWREDPGSEWIRRAELIPVALANSLTKKKAIKYPSGTELFIYLNIGEYGIRQREIEAEIMRQLDAPLGPFCEIYVLWKEKLFASSGKCWPRNEESQR
ncbi:hypothetical protein [Nitrobacter sp. TKz-YC02]|uniref:hypothetical protein n=1 Tax=Nitrobacter sp. TKz-YC02 TaxID=3398704 RepID=UPI003CF91AE7